MIKRILLLLFPVICSAQPQLPSYPDILNHFYSYYSFEPANYLEGLSFAKKKDSWYVHVIDRQTENVKNEQVLWSNGNFHRLKNFNSPDKEAFEENVKRAMESIDYSFYGYERSPYFGYAGWDLDVISYLGNQDLSIVKDTLLDGLGRAYSAYASRFLWYQYGGEINSNDSLKQKLPYGTRPSKRRADSVEHFINKAILAFDVLARKNPHYKTIVGNAVMKRTNEQIHGYVQMILSGQPSMAKKFLDTVEPDSTLQKLAVNFLSGCAPNSILFTAGDNDTYPLIYMQEKINFRKDVIVINRNLLGIPFYIDYLKQKHPGFIQLEEKIYQAENFQYSLYNPGKDSSNSDAEVFLESIKAQVNRNPMANPVYQEKKIIIKTDTAEFQKSFGDTHLSPGITVTLGEYIVLDDYMTLLIASEHLTGKSIYFTYPPDIIASTVIQEGFVHRLIPFNPNEKNLHESRAIARIIYFINNHFQPMPSNYIYAKSLAASAMDLPVYQMFHKIISHYNQSGQNKLANEWIERFKITMKNQFPFSPFIPQVALLFIESGNKTDGILLLEDFVTTIFDLWKRPSSLQPVMTKDRLLEYYHYLDYSLKTHNMKNATLDRYIDLLEKD